jgi:hypothetical protein
MLKPDYELTAAEYKQRVEERQRALRAKRRWTVWDEITMLQRVQNGEEVKLQLDALRRMFALKDAEWQHAQALFCSALLNMDNCRGQYRKAVENAKTARCVDWASALDRERAQS